MSSRQLAHPGMTLVELLVVVTIMVLLLAISVPMLKPALDSRRTSEAAHVLAGAFRLARTKAIQEQRSYGIQLRPYETSPTTTVQLWLVKGSTALEEDYVNDFYHRVTVESGNIIPYRFDEAVNEWHRSADFTELEAHFKPGYAVQFNRIGRFFSIGGGYQLLAPYHNINLPDEPVNNYGIPMEYRIAAKPTSSATWLPPVVMPRGMVVDLVFSGGETADIDGNEKTADDIPASFSAGDEIVVMFSPAGHVDLIYVNDKSQKVNEMLYFCIGEWDRQIDAVANKTFAEDGESNLKAPATYWVTLHPKTGGVRIAENAPLQLGSDTQTKQLRDARRFAREHFFNIGEN